MCPAFLWLSCAPHGQKPHRVQARSLQPQCTPVPFLCGWCHLWCPAQASRTPWPRHLPQARLARPSRVAVPLAGAMAALPVPGKGWREPVELMVGGSSLPQPFHHADGAWGQLWPSEVWERHNIRRWHAGTSSGLLARPY